MLAARGASSHRGFTRQPREATRAAVLSSITLVSAILTDAKCFDADVTTAVWVNTICPRGVNSDDYGDACRGQFILQHVPTGCAAG